MHLNYQEIKMTVFDPHFEGFRLSMFAQQYPDIANKEGKVIFLADEDKDEIFVTRWNFDDAIYNEISESNFKIQFILLLDIFIRYRSECGEPLRREGVVSFGNGRLDIGWLPNGSVVL